MKLLADALHSAIPEIAGHDHADLTGRVGDFFTAEAHAIEVFKRRLAGLMCGVDTGAKLIEQGKRSARLLAQHCESPIEAMMCAPLVFADYDGFLNAPAEVLIPKDPKLGGLGDVFIIPQFAFVKYRADFAIFGVRGTSQKIVVLECDGRQFHEDAAKDRARDALFEALGVTVVRATGREIYEEPQSVAARVAVALTLWRLAQELGV